MKDNNRIAMSDSILVASNKSSRLANMANRIKPLMAKNNPNSKEIQWVQGLKPEIKTALQQAEHLIVEKLESIFKVFPEGKKKAFFKIKYGIKEEAIKDMPRNEAFKLLQLDTTKVKQFRLIANLNVNGKIVE